MFCLTCSIPLILQQHPMLLCVRIDGFITTRNEQERTQIHNTSWNTQNTHHEVTTDNKLATCIICTITSTRINHVLNQQLVFPSESRILNYLFVFRIISIYIISAHDMFKLINAKFNWNDWDHKRSSQYKIGYQYLFPPIELSKIWYISSENKTIGYN